MNWRRLFPIIFIFSCFDGFIVNLFYPAKLPFLYKDILILIVYIIFFISREPNKRWVFEFKTSVGSGTWYLAMLLMFLGLVQIFNPGVTNPLVGVLGFKTMFFYWPLAILAYAYVDDLDCLERFMKTIVYISIPICIFGIYQFWKGPDFLVKVFGQGFARGLFTAGAGVYGGKSFLRVPGTFASTGQFTSFLVVSSMFTLGLLFTARNQLTKLVMIGSLVLTYITMLCTGSRGGAIMLFATTLILVILCRWLWRGLFIILLLGISFNFGFSYLGQGVYGRMKTVTDLSMIRGRTVDVASGMLGIYLQKYPFGRGMGTASLAGRHLSLNTSLDLELIENYVTKLQCELGIFGLAIFYLLLLNLLVRWNTHNWLKSIDRRHYIFVAVLTAYCWARFCASFFDLIDAPPAAIFLWAELGIVARLATFQSDDKYPLST